MLSPGAETVKAFYLGHPNGHPDPRVTSAYVCYAADDMWLETTHNYIQWAFPLLEVPNFVPNAPFILKSDITELRGAYLLDAQREVANRMLKFYTDYTFWRNGAINHNHARITRIIKSLKLLQKESRHAQWFFHKIVSLTFEDHCDVPSISHDFWSDALSYDS